jgi:hypothetical protein
MKSGHCLSVCLLVACCHFAPSAAFSAPLPSSTVLVPSPGEPDPTGGAVVASLAAPFSVAGAFSGTLTTTVLSGDPSNALGGLTFTYELANDGKAGPHSLGRMTVKDFAGWLVDASYQSTSAGVVPGSIDRQPSADVIGFNFLPTPVDVLTSFLVPGTTSRKLVLQTNAPAYADSLASLINGNVTQVATFGPVPEPSTWLLLALGAAALAARRRR